MLWHVLFYCAGNSLLSCDLTISQFAAALRQRSSQDKRDLLVADTLDSLCRHCDLYDAARVSSNPFHPELLRAIASYQSRARRFGGI